MSFLPKDYEAPKSSSDKYMKFQDGPNRFRVLGSAVTGYELWKGGRPVRQVARFSREDLESADPNKDGTPQKERHFWAFPVWDYADGKVKVLSVTQKGVQEAISALVSNPKWGDPHRYDLTVDRSGEGLETRYIVQPDPPSELEPDQAAAWKGVRDKGFDVRAYLDNGDPFNPEIRIEQID